MTIDAAGQLEKVHDRMPLMLPQVRWTEWLDPEHPASADLLDRFARRHRRHHLRRVSTW